MSYSYFLRPLAFTLAGLALVGSSAVSAETSATAFRDAIDAVNAQAPQHYDPIVTPLPDEGAIESKPTLELLRMLDSWNPALRSAAAKALGTRGDEAIPVLLKATESNNGPVRAGSASALAAIIKQKLSNWKESYPEMNDAREAQEKILEDHDELSDAFVRLSQDPRIDVRVSALEGLSSMAPQTADAVQAVLKLCNDEDEYLAQEAMITLDKRFSINAIQEETVVAALKQAMRSPLPRGKGHVMKVVQKMDERSQRKFIPEMLAHLDWEPRRDTMFAAGGQEDSIRLLTKLRVKELVPRLPNLMFKALRGPGLFMPCLEAAQDFGRDAKALIPTFRKMLSEYEQEGAKKMRDHEERLEKLRETIAYLEKQ